MFEFEIHPLILGGWLLYFEFVAFSLELFSNIQTIFFFVTGKFCIMILGFVFSKKKSDSKIP